VVGALPHTPLGEFTALPRLPRFRGLTSKRKGRRMGWEEIDDTQILSWGCEGGEEGREKKRAGRSGCNNFPFTPLTRCN